MLKDRDMRREFSAGAVIYYRDEEHDNTEYLILRYGTSHWDFAKGKLEPGETNEETALREIHEETGLYVTLAEGFEHKLFYRFRGRDGELVSKQVIFFVARAPAREIILSCEHSEGRWLPYEEARRLLTFDNAVQLLDVAHAFIMRSMHN